MCDALVALRPATAGPWSLFAKNSDRPPGERQVYEWQPPRRERSTTRATYIEVEAARTDTLGCLISRPTWMWGAEHGVNEASVAVGNTTVYTLLDPRRSPPALTGMDLVRLALERASTAADAVEVITTMIERYGQGGSGQQVDVDGQARPYWSSFLVTDCVTAFVVDTSGAAWAVEQVQEVYTAAQAAGPTPEAFHTEASWHQLKGNSGRGRAAADVGQPLPVSAHFISTVTMASRGSSATRGQITFARTKAGLLSRILSPL